MLTSKAKRNLKGKEGIKKMILISVNVVGSAGPIRFIVSEDDLVGDVIGRALKIYGREGRLPVLGFDGAGFMLLCPTADSDRDRLDPLERIDSSGSRNFLLCKKPQEESGAEDLEGDLVLTKNVRKGLKSWINKSLGVGISTQ